MGDMGKAAREASKEEEEKAKAVIPEKVGSAAKLVTSGVIVQSLPRTVAKALQREAASNVAVHITNRIAQRVIGKEAKEKVRKELEREVRAACLRWAHRCSPKTVWKRAAGFIH